jgi:hypothetical protein
MNCFKQVVQKEINISEDTITSLIESKLVSVLETHLNKIQGLDDKITSIIESKLTPQLEKIIENYLLSKGGITLSSITPEIKNEN